MVPATPVAGTTFEENDKAEFPETAVSNRFREVLFAETLIIIIQKSGDTAHVRKTGSHEQRTFSAGNAEH